MFKVVPDQLRVSEGWVRCGQCEEVFDANAHMQGAVNAGGALRPTQAEHRGVIEAPTFGETDPRTYNGLDADPANYAVEVEEKTVLADLGSTLEWPPESTPLTDVFVDSGAHEKPMPASGIRQDATALADSGAVLIPVGDFVPPQAPTMAAMKAPSFVRSTKKRAHKPQRPALRWAHRLVATALLLGLGLQWVHHERDVIAASVPQARPWMVQLCEVAGCAIAPMQQIESVIIDSSSFVPIRADVYQLNLTLRNKAALDIAVPALELTLTDLQDQPIVRRVLTASAWGASNQVLAAGAELSTSIPVSVKQVAGGEPVRGYRVLAFYP